MFVLEPSGKALVGERVNLRASSSNLYLAETTSDSLGQHADINSYGGGVNPDISGYGLR